MKIKSIATGQQRSRDRTAARMKEAQSSSEARSTIPARFSGWRFATSAVAHSDGDIQIEGQRAMSVAESWSRVMSLLREHAPADHADLPGPATEDLIAAAEERMGIALHRDLRTWLLQNSLDLPEEDVDDDVMCCGFNGFPDEGSFFLGIRAMERLYANRSRPWGFDPPDQPDDPFWRNEWIPFLSDQDGWSGKFIDVRDGRVGSWFVGDPTVTGEYESMAQYFDFVADMLKRIAAGNNPICKVVEGRLVWS
ncbi:SMI1/KNR4 family protein [Streptomyces cinereoruber]|uniref:SMI1/KNR4 family protein n=1 Tax=Streptomyces cinereoruber TaxID=67260 RepID=UPI003634287A